MNKSIQIGVYEIRNTINNKIYIGSSINIKRRFERHKCDLNNNNHFNKHLQRAWNKYGKDNFRFKIIEIIKKDLNLLNREQYWLDITQCYIEINGYNIAKFAGSPTKGRKLTEEHKLKISNSEKGKIVSDITKGKLRKANLGKKLSEETKKKGGYSRRGINNCNYKKIFSLETMERMSKANIGKRLSKETKEKIGKKSSKPVICIELNKKFKSIKECSDVLNLDSSAISKVCNGKQKTTGGYRFKHI